MSGPEYIDHFRHIPAIYRAFWDKMSVFTDVRTMYWERIFTTKGMPQQVTRCRDPIKVTKLAASLKASAGLVPDAMPEVSSERRTPWVNKNLLICDGQAQSIDGCVSIVAPGRRKAELVNAG